MSNMMLGDSTLESLTTSVNAPLVCANLNFGWRFFFFFLVGPWLETSKREKSLVCQLGMNERWNEFAVSKLNRDSLVLT
jgi:hypothetical protein